MMPRSFLIAILLSLLGYLVVSCESTILIVDNDDRGVFNSWEASLQTKAKHSIDYKHYSTDGIWTNPVNGGNPYQYNIQMAYGFTAL